MKVYLEIILDFFDATEIRLELEQREYGLLLNKIEENYMRANMQRI